METQTIGAPGMAVEHNHEIIWLQPWCDGCDLHCHSGEGRQWCADNAWGSCDECGRPAVKYKLAPDQPARKGIR